MGGGAHVWGDTRSPGTQTVVARQTPGAAGGTYLERPSAAADQGSDRPWQLVLDAGSCSRRRGRGFYETLVVPPTRGLGARAGPRRAGEPPQERRGALAA